VEVEAEFGIFGEEEAACAVWGHLVAAVIGVGYGD